MGHDVLYHVTARATLDAAGESLGAQPFLHCCTEAQLPFVLARHFSGRAGLLILRFRPQDVQGHIVWEQSEPGQEPFPHLYGSLPLGGVTLAAAPARGGERQAV